MNYDLNLICNMFEIKRFTPVCAGLLFSYTIQILDSNLKPSSPRVKREVFFLLSDTNNFLN